MVRATTPTFLLTLPKSVDLTLAKNVYFTAVQNPVAITKTGEDLTINENEVSVYFSQDETLKFSAGTVRIQLNWTYTNGERACSEIVNVKVTDNLLGMVVE